MKINVVIPGVLIALIIGLCVFYFGGPSTFPESFVSATNFFWWWALTCSIIAMALVALGLFIIWLIAIIGSSRMSAFGRWWFFSKLEARATKIVFVLIISLALSLSGAWLIDHAVTIPADGAVQWHMTQLIVGSVLLIINLSGFTLRPHPKKLKKVSTKPPPY